MRVRIALCALLTMAPAGAREFYVATGGRDSNPGTRARPFATVERARDTIRPLIAAGLKSNVTVLVRGGTYTLRRPVVFGLADSGTEKYGAVYDDPMFVDIECRDFRFKPGSPAVKLGIKPIDLKQVGLTPEFPKRLLR